MIRPTSERIDPELGRQIVEKTRVDTMNLLAEFKQLGGQLPEELSYGMVAGYLRGKGYSWDEAFVTMNRWIWVMSQLAPAQDMVGEMTIRGGDGEETKIELKKS